MGTFVTYNTYKSAILLCMVMCFFPIERFNIELSGSGPTGPRSASASCYDKSANVLIVFEIASDVFYLFHFLFNMGGIATHAF